MKREFVLLSSLIVLAIAVEAQDLPPGEGKEIVQQKCGGCHAMKVVTSKRATKDQWAALVNQMITRGAEVEDEEIETVVAYLAKNFGRDAPPSDDKAADSTSQINVNHATAAELAAALHLSEKESKAIVSYREQNGKFQQWRDLGKVPGIDMKKIEANKDRLVF